MRVVGLFVAERGFRLVFPILCHETGKQSRPTGANFPVATTFFFFTMRPKEPPSTPRIRVLQVCPSWPMEELFVIEIHQGALSYDQTSRRPITSSVCTTAEILGQFDVITYRKSPSVLRMLRYLVTEKLFQLSLRHYLNAKR